MRKIVFALSVLALVWINRYFWFLPRNQKVDLEPYSVAVQAIDEKTGDRLDGAEFICYEYDDEGNYAKSEYKEGICYFYDLEPETNYIVGQTYFVGSYIPEVREYTVYVNSDGSIEYLTGSYVDRSGILTFKNYLAGRDFYGDNTTFWVVVIGLSSASVVLLVVMILVIYKLNKNN